jgi:hypothetical protein
MLFRAVIERPVGSVENLRYLEWGVKVHAGGDCVTLEADSSRLTFETALAMFSQPAKQREKRRPWACLPSVRWKVGQDVFFSS